MRRRLDVGLGIVHRPSVLFLDEPTTGLDPQARARMWDEIRSLRDAGNDRLPDDALPRGGRRAGRPAGDHRPRQDRGRGHRRRAQATGRRRRRDARRQRRDRARPRDRPAAAVRARGDQRGRPRPALRRPRRDGRSAAPPRPRRRRAARPPRSPSIARASTTSSSARPAARCATRRRPDPPPPPLTERNHRREDHPRHLAHLPAIAHPDPPAARLDRLRDDACRSSTSSCSGRCSRAPTKAAGAGTQRLQLVRARACSSRSRSSAPRSSASGSSPSCATASSSGCA